MPEWRGTSPTLRGSWRWAGLGLALLALAVPSISVPLAQASQGATVALSFGDGSGSIARDTKGDHDGVVDGATWATAGKYGQALDFDGTNDVVTIPDSDDLQFRDGFTLEAWLKPNQQRAWQPVVMKQNSSDLFSYLLYAEGGSGHPSGYIDASDGSYSSVDATSLPTSSWSHLALSSDGTDMRIYVDGDLVDTAPALPVRSSDGDLQIGGNDLEGEYFDGLIDEVRLYDRPLAGSEIADDRDTAIGSGTALPTTISADTTLAAGNSPYTGSDVTIDPGATLTVEPGVTVSLYGEMTVHGTIDADGTAANPILFTSKSDTGPGQWYGINLDANSGDSVIDNTEIRYSHTGVTSRAPSAIISNSSVHDNRTCGVAAYRGQVKDSLIADTLYGPGICTGGDPVISGNTVTGNGEEGIRYSAGSTSDGTVAINDNTVADNGDAGISISTRSPYVDGQSLSGNEVSDNGGIGIYYYAYIATIPPDIDDNEQSGNAPDATEIDGDLASSTTWEDRGYPIVVGAADLEVRAGNRLTLGPGMIIKGANGLIGVDGEIDASAAPGQDPIVMTSISDDSVGGDTNQDGGTTAPSSDDWYGLYINASSTYSRLQGIDLAHAHWGVEAYGPDVHEVTDSRIHDNLGAGLTLAGSGALIRGNELDHNGGSGLKVTGSSSPEIASNNVHDNSQGGGYSDAAGVSLDFGDNPTAEVNLHNNLIESNGSGLKVSSRYRSGWVSGTTLADNDISDNSGDALTYNVYGSVPPDISSTSLEDNATNAAYLSGTVVEPTTLTDQGYPYVLSYGHDFSVAADATLTLAPGVVVKGGNQTIAISGDLEAEGTGAEPVVFTSVYDPAGADTSHGSNKRPAPGQWPGLYFSSTATGHMKHVRLSYASVATRILCSCNDPLHISHAKVTNNYEGININGQLPSAEPDIAEWVQFHGNTEYAVYSHNTPNDTAVAHSSFGCESGPAPMGCGDQVSSNVTTPALEAATPEECVGADDDCDDSLDPVTVSTGALSYSHTDLSLPSATMAPLAFRRYYNSGSDLDTGMGPGWFHPGLLKASELPSGDIVVLRGSGRQDRFQNVGGGAYAPTRNVHDRLLKEGDGTLELRTRQQSVYVFDDTGRISTITDDHGLARSYGYNGSGRLSSITDEASGQQLMLSYDSTNHITGVEDSAGRQVTYGYTSGDLTTVTDALGGITTYSYDADHHLTSIIDPRDVTFLQNDYDAQGRIVEQADGNGNAWSADYAPGETALTEPEGGEQHYEFDSLGRTVSVSDELGHATTYSYDSGGNRDEVSRPGGADVALDYDADGNLVAVTNPEGDETSYTYDAANRRTSVTDPRGKEWDYDYNSDGDLVAITDPLNHDTTFTYDANGMPETVTDPNGHTTTYDYADDGTLNSVEDPLGHTTSYGYDDYGQLTSITRPGLAPETYERNELGDLLSSTTPEGHETTYAYDANGALISTTDPLSHTWTIDRDAMEHPITYTDPAQNTSTIAYDGNFNRTSVTDRNGHTTNYAYDEANRLTEIDAPATGAWQFGYDARGNRDQVIDPRSHTTDYAFDLNDRLTEADEPLSTTSSYDYDPAGNLSSITDPKGHTTTFTYDALGRRTQMDQPLGKTTTYDYDPAGNLTARTTAEDSLDLTYDDADRLAEISDGSQALRSFAYDDANRMTAATDAQAKTLALAYDDEGNLTQIDDARGETVARSFDAAGNLSTQTDGRGTLGYAHDELNRLSELTDTNNDTMSFSYDPEGNLISSELPNGVTTLMSYDNANRLASTSSQDASSNVLQSFGYDYDPAGNRVSVTNRNSETTSYDYDALNRLSEYDPPGSAETTYAYDAAGNRTQAGPKTFAYNALNELTSDSSGTDYAYDDAGRLINQTNGSDSTDYSYDALDQLTQVDDGSSPISYTYDGLGRRAERTDGSDTNTTHYGDLTDSATLDTGSSGPIATYLRGPAGLAEHTDGTETSFPLADAHGDITTLSDDTGAVSSRQAYDPWGVQDSGPALAMGWLGAQERRADPASGLTQMGIRAYDPALGQFLSEDPLLLSIGVGATGDRHAYAGENPLNRYDLDGRCFVVCDAWDAAADIGGSIGGVASDWWNNPAEILPTATSYWAHSDSPLAYAAGPATEAVETFTNPDRVARDYGKNKSCSASVGLPELGPLSVTFGWSTDEGHLHPITGLGIGFGANASCADGETPDLSSGSSVTVGNQCGGLANGQPSHPPKCYGVEGGEGVQVEW